MCELPSTKTFVDVLQVLCLSRKDLKDLLCTYDNLELFKPPVVNGWFVPRYKQLLSGALLLISGDEGDILRAKRIVELGRSNGQWHVHLEDGTAVEPDAVCELDSSELDDATLAAVQSDLNSTLQQGGRKPIPLHQSMEVAERRIQMEKCGLPVRRLMEIQEDALRLEGNLSFLYGPERPDPGVEGDQTEAAPLTSPSLTQIWDETVSLASQIAFLLRKKLSREEQLVLQDTLQGFCAAEAAAAAGKAGGAVR